MRIAIATEGGRVSAHFGHCEGFTVYESDSKENKGGVFIPNPGHQPGFLPVFLKNENVNVIIAGGMGERAQSLFAESGIDVVVGAHGRCDDVMDKYLQSELVSSGEACREHMHNCEDHQ